MCELGGEGRRLEGKGVVIRALSSVPCEGPDGEPPYTADCAHAAVVVCAWPNEAG